MTTRDSTISVANPRIFQAKLIEQGVAKSTRTAYIRAWKKFTEFLANLDEDPQTWEDRLMLFFTRLSEQGKASSTIRTYMAGVKSRLKIEGVTLNENHYLLKLMYRGTAKQDSTRLRLPITREMLGPLLRRVDLAMKDEFDHLLFGAIIAAAYYGAFRIGELVGSDHAVKIGNVVGSKTSDKVRILLHSSKTHKMGTAPEAILIEPTGEERCPCELLNEYSQRRWTVSQYWKDKPSCFFVHKDGCAVAEFEVLRVMRKALGLIHGVENLDYGTHSLRAGRAMDLFRKGVTEPEIKQISHWKSAAVYRYIKL